MRALILATAGLALAACTTTGTRNDTQPVAIPFALVKDGQPVGCGQPFKKLGTGKAPSRLHDARFYVQDVALIDTAGKAVPVTLAVNEWQTGDAKSGQVALLDFENGSDGCVGTKAINTVVTGTVPPGQYAGVSFAVGVPEALNHTSIEKSPPPLDSAALNWSWQAGRKFMKVELDPKGGVTKPDGTKAATWFLHLGSTECAGNPASGEAATCKRPNRVPVRFPAFDPAKQAVALDLGALFAESDLSKDHGQAVGCMSGPTDGDCPVVFGRLGLALETGLPVNPGQSPAFRLVAKP